MQIKIIEAEILETSLFIVIKCLNNDSALHYHRPPPYIYHAFSMYKKGIEMV